MNKRKITVKGLLKLLDDLGSEVEWVFKPKSMNEMARGRIFLRELEDYFPSAVKLMASRLERKGLVEMKDSPEGLVVRITDRGKLQILKYKLSEFSPKKGKWDGEWRLVFFDVAEVDKKKRDELRRYLKKLGMERMQDSVFVSPWDVEGEIRYLREVLGIPHGVKLARLKWIENEGELREIFGVG